MIKKLSLNMEIIFEDSNTCNLVYSSLSVETQYKVNERAKVTLNTEENKLLLQIQAEDSVSARAAMNSYLKWVNMSLQIIEKTK
ncbi:MAG: KEOPS complex subunit Pcc1 [Candidatus Heimdallarchaeaceae archaeon]